MALKVEDVRMWDYYNQALYANMEDQLDEKIMGEGNALIDKQHVLLEEKVCPTPGGATEHSRGAASTCVWK